MFIFIGINFINLWLDTVVKEESEMKSNDKLLINSPSEVPVPSHVTTSDIISIIEPDKQFKLAPTPAQLGRAPLQRRQSMGKKN